MSRVEIIDSPDGIVDLADFINDNEKVVVVFSARDWCIPCQRLAPHIEKLSDEFPELIFVDVDIDHVHGVKEDFGIMSVPQVWYYENAMEGSPGVELKGRTTIQLVRELNGHL